VCGTSCGDCDIDEVCTVDGQCLAGCTPDCGARVCGPDPVCSVSCGSCLDHEVCSADGVCELEVMYLLPESGEVSGWLEDTSLGQEGPEATDDLATATSWVDGIMDIIDAESKWVALAREFYAKDFFSIGLTIYEMSDELAAMEAYLDTVNYHGVIWGGFDFEGGEDTGRFGILTMFCYASAAKGKYFVETITHPDSGDNEAKAFTKAVLEGIPPSM
jgi:hypothetical protein